MTSSTSINKVESDNKKTKPKKDNNARFILLAVLIVAMLVLILGRTIMLQLGDGEVSGVIESVGNRRQMVVPAARGDIVDVNGVPLAFSAQTRALYISNANLDDHRLNRMLLDLSDLLLEDGVVYSGNLPNYFDLSSTSREAGQEARFVFRQDADAILAWQTDRNILNLVDPETATTAQRNRVARLDPRELFEYLLYDVFGIEDKDAGGSRLYSDKEAYRIMQLRYTLLENNWLYRTGNPILIVDDISQRLEQVINDQSYRYPGVLMENHYSRRYSAYSDYAGHVIGYIGSISGQEYEQLKRFDYSLNSMVGKSGVELSAERYLKGLDGYKPYLVFVDDETQTSLDGGTLPQHGAEIRLTLDIDLQKTAVESMQRAMERLRALDLEKEIAADTGAFVVMNPKTGGIYAMGGLPDYKVSDFVNQAFDRNAAERMRAYLTDNETKPMLNRAISENYAPASTFKAITSLAALESGTVTPQHNSYTCVGTEDIGGWIWSCLQRPTVGHGSINLTQGLTTSCNMYFYHMGVETGIDNISLYAKQLGLGELTGIDLPGEVAGIRPSREMKALLRSKPEDKTWFIADTAQTSIGQFDHSYTMLQMARAVSGLATGYLVRPHVISEIIGSDGVVLREEQIERVPLGFAEENLTAIRNGMINVTRGGTSRAAHLFRDFPVAVAAKTGTAQVGHGQNSYQNAIFVAYAPADDPVIAVAYMVEDATYGEQIADVAYEVFCEYFGVTPKQAEPLRPIIIASG